MNFASLPCAEMGNDMTNINEMKSATSVHKRVCMRLLAATAAPAGERPPFIV